ncbi:hypothetical protein ACTMTI_46065 [Nonomuraea sp. H19]
MAWVTERQEPRPTMLATPRRRRSRPSAALCEALDCQAELHADSAGA